VSCRSKGATGFALLWAACISVVTSCERSCGVSILDVTPSSA
jgi:hypothetical protein